MSATAGETSDKFLADFLRELRHLRHGQFLDVLRRIYHIEVTAHLCFSKKLYHCTAVGCMSNAFNQSLFRLFSPFHQHRFQRQRAGGALLQLLDLQFGVGDFRLTHAS